MDIKDVKVGMLVQLNDNSKKQGCVGKVESIDYLDELVMLRLEGVTTNSGHNSNTVHNRWSARPYRFDVYQDPEADMVVWDALEVGEHFIATTGQEAVKISEAHYIVLNIPIIYAVSQSRLGKLIKLKLA